MRLCTGLVTDATAENANETINLILSKSGRNTWRRNLRNVQKVANHSVCQIHSLYTRYQRRWRGARSALRQRCSYCGTTLMQPFRRSHLLGTRRNAATRACIASLRGGVQAAFLTGSMSRVCTGTQLFFNGQHVFPKSHCSRRTPSLVPVCP